MRIDLCRGIDCERLDGSIRGEDRSVAISRFTASTVPGNLKVFLLSTRAGGVGLNLASASTVIFMDSDWNPHVDMQAIARAYRQGQSAEKVNVYRILTADTVDEYIYIKAKSKLSLATGLNLASDQAIHRQTAEVAVVARKRANELQTIVRDMYIM